MEEKKGTSKCSFTSVTALSQMGINSVPDCYILPQSHRPTLDHGPHSSTISLPVIDLSSLGNPLLRSTVIEQVHVACQEHLMQVINHGIPIPIVDQALEVAAEFFDMPNAKKMRIASTDAREQKDIEEGSQVMAVNFYPACPEPNLTLGLPPHSDYGLLTILLQNQCGLETMDNDGKWQSVPAQELVDEQHPLSYEGVSFGDFLHFLSENDILRLKLEDCNQVRSLLILTETRGVYFHFRYFIQERKCAKPVFASPINISSRRLRGVTWCDALDLLTICLLREVKQDERAV